MALKTVLHRLARRLPCASEMYALFDAEYASAEGCTETGAAHRSTANARPRLRDVLNNHRFTTAPQATASETAPVPAENPAPEPEVAPPALEAALIAFDNATDEESYQAVVKHCKTIDQTLLKAHRGVLRAKIKQAKARIGIPHKEVYTHAETKAPVAMSEGHTEAAGPPMNIGNLEKPRRLHFLFLKTLVYCSIWVFCEHIKYKKQTISFGPDLISRRDLPNMRFFEVPYYPAGEQFWHGLALPG